MRIRPKLGWGSGFAASLAATLCLALAVPGIAQAHDDDDDDRGRRYRRRSHRLPNGLSRRAKRELRRAGVDKYLSAFHPVSSTPYAVDWVKHTFDRDGGDGPICIGGGEYSVFTKAGNPDKVMIFLQGGGACWENFPACNTTAEAQFPIPQMFLPGVFAKTSPDGSVANPLGDWSVVYFPYCDGSVYGGDNDVPNDPIFGTRRHRGLRNLSAGMDVARDVFPHPDKVLVTGSSAGGVGATAFAPFLARFVYGNHIDLYVLNDAGPIAGNPIGAPDAARARQNDWQFGQFYPRSCVRSGLCDPLGQATGLTVWRMANDYTIREGFYETDGDRTNLGFIQSNAPGSPAFVPVSQAQYRAILDAEHGRLNRFFPRRYKRFLVSGANPICGGRVVYSHTTLQGADLANFGCSGIDLYYELESHGVTFLDWANDLVTSRDADRCVPRRSRRCRRLRRSNDWVDIVEPFAPGPPLP